MYDFLIIGQGLAGTTLAYFLKAAGSRVILLDDAQPGAATRVAAGIINPVTGRNFVKSWRIDDLLPFAIHHYRILQDQIGLPILRECSIVRALHSIEEENLWLERCADPGYQKYLSDQPVLEGLPPWVQPAHSFGEIRGGAQVEVGLLVEAMRRQWLEEGMLVSSTVDYQKLVVSNEGVRYEDIEARQAIFCDGRWGKSNPWFNFLPLRGDKGEVLQVKFHDDIPLSHILKHHLFIVPRGDNTYWIGANYASRYLDDLPSDQGKIWLEQNLKRSVNCPFEVLEHTAAIRPTVSDRRPLLGQHPEYSRLFIFNGLGTKGTSLAPYWANHMCTWLSGLGALDPEVDIQRFA